MTDILILLDGISRKYSVVENVHTYIGHKINLMKKTESAGIQGTEPLA